MNFADWLDLAKKAENQSVDSEHVYWQLSDHGPDSWIADDLHVFRPQRGFFIIDETQNRGINCRFGSRGIIAETHYDGG